MKKLILIAIGLVAAGAFVGFDAVGAFVDKTRTEVRSTLMSPEMELQSQLASAAELSEKCSDSVLKGRMALARLDAMIEQRGRDLARRRQLLQRDRKVLETRRALLQQGREIYLISNERVSRQTVNRDALLRAKSYSTDKEILAHLEKTLVEMKAQRAQTAAEIEEATVEMGRLGEEVTSLKAELENLKARRAVARTREEAKFIFDRSAFDKARDKISEIKANIAQQNGRLDFFSRTGLDRKGLIPAEAGLTEEDGVQAIAAALGEPQIRPDKPDVSLAADPNR